MKMLICCHSNVNSLSRNCNKGEHPARFDKITSANPNFKCGTRLLTPSTEECHILLFTVGCTERQG